MQAINLKTEYLKNPVGIDVTSPRLMWTCEGGEKQTAYRIVATSEGKQIWDSGKVQSDNMYAVFSLKLSSRQRVAWSVTLWDENDKEGEASEACFETGLLNPTDWQSKWITGDCSPSKDKRYPVDCFMKKFMVNGVKKARLYITACGLYEARINSNRVGEFILAPGSTDYRKRIQYQSYDVTDLLKSGDNEIAIELGDGWYRGSSGSKGRLNTYGKQTKFIAQLEIEDESGKKAIVTDGTWGVVERRSNRICRP